MTELGQNITFAATVPVLLPGRSANGSFLKDSSILNDNTPPMPLYDAHPGGFFFCNSLLINLNHENAVENSQNKKNAD